MDKLKFLEMVQEDLKEKYDVSVDTAKPYQLHESVASVIMDAISPRIKKSRQAHLKSRRACYFSMEFLMGRMVQNNLLCLGIKNEVDSALTDAGASLNAFEEIEDAALGNGGLGRLAACFLDSAATHDLPLDGYGIRYKFGYFKQRIENGFQVEMPDDWTKYGDPWSKKCEKDAVTVKYADSDVIAIPYDMPIIGYKTENVGNLRLWEAHAKEEFDFKTFDSGDYLNASGQKTLAEDISRILYPNDNTEAGKRLRLKQQYFFCSASLQDIIRKHKIYHGDLSSLADYVTIQLNDTHPVISIPELLRILVDEEKMSFDKAISIAKRVFNYTNHTIMQEALEKWDASLFESVVPRVYDFVLMINEEFIREMYLRKIDRDIIKELAVVSDNLVKMANLAVYVSSYTNGVAQIHTEILKNSCLKEWYEIYPERFQNKTNGITQRRWLALCNKELSSLITSLIGDGWVKDLSLLKGLERFADDEEILRRFISVKNEKKRQLADYILEHDGKVINPNTIFDIQIKRLHEYKRQLLNALSVLCIYYGIKDGSIKSFTPTTIIFGAKSSPGYRRAKAIIKFISEIGNMVNSDPDTKDILNVVFISNYNVSYAEKLVAAADVSEQISTAGTEASGTGNMKLMLNGAVTLGTLDGANVEIVQEAGEENNYIFGAKADELEKIMPEYDPRKILSSNERVRSAVNKLIDGSFDDGKVPSNQEGSFKELYKALTDGASWHVPDHYYVLGDLPAYVSRKLDVNRDYRDTLAFARKCWMNIANAGKFSSDRTIKDYAANIWNIVPIEL